MIELKLPRILRRDVPPTKVAPAAFLGVYGIDDPAEELRRAGVEAAFVDGDIAFGGAPVWAERSGRFVVSGEVLIDNRDELTRELGLQDGVDDGAILAELFSRRGVDAGRYVLGMYAVAVWDGRDRQLTLLRDGLGARTIYHGRVGRSTWFGTRLSTVHRAPGMSNEISLTAMRDYLICAFVPGTQTMWRDIDEVRPGTALTLPGGHEHRFWEPIERESDPDEPLAEAAARLRPLLDDAVRVRLPKSGPLGVFLSGGLDSSLVTAIAARDAAGPVHTYAIHFGSQHAHELEFSSLVSAHCGTKHHVLELPARLIQDMLPETMAALDDPIGDPLTVPNLLLGRTAKADVDVILNGEGGDPCFGGPKNVPMLLHQLYGGHEEWEAAYFRSFQKCYDDLPRLLTVDVRRRLVDMAPPEAMLAPFLRDQPMTAYLNRLMHINTQLKGSDQILTKVNNLTSYNGLLGRSPLFDRRVVEESFAIPAEHKLAGSDEKAVLKAAVADLLPSSILTRPKSGMMVPVRHWFRHELRGYATRVLLGRDARTRDYVEAGVIREWLRYEGGLWPRHGIKLWLLLTLEEWLRVNE